MTFDIFSPVTLVAQAQAGGGLTSTMLLLVAMGAIFYFLLLRPQQQQRKRHQEMVEGLKRGDEIILQGGLYGKIIRVQDDVVEVEIAKDVVVKQVKSMILNIATKPEPQEKKK